MTQAISKLLHPIKLKGGEIKGNLFLAPLAGYTDKAFRTVAIYAGADFTFTEMVSAEGIARGNLKTFQMAEPAPDEKDYAIQIFGADYRSALQCSLKLLPFKPFLIDLNCGCSVPKILKSGAGGMLLKNPERIAEIIRALSENLPVRLSVKLRSGWDNDHINYLETAEAAIRAGASLVTLHPRTCCQQFRGKADWKHIKILKGNVAVPVIGSGDVLSPGDALRLLSETGCDGVMFARAAIGNPFIFKQTKLLALGNINFIPSACERLVMALRQLRILCSYKQELKACQEMRKHMAGYLKGLPQASELRRSINVAETVQAYEEIIFSYVPQAQDLLNQKASG